jgi:hypothetical protein
MSDPLTTPPTITTTILAKGRSTLGHETNLARVPIWHARPRSADGETVVTPILFGHPFRKVEGRTVTTTDQRLFAHLTTSYIRTGCPASRQVPFSLGDAASAVGHEMLGGKQRWLVRASLGRLRSVTFESALRHADGNETVLGWGLIDSYLVTTCGGGKGWVKLSEAVASLLQEGSVTFPSTPRPGRRSAPATKSLDGSGASLSPRASGEAGGTRSSRQRAPPRDRRHPCPPSPRCSSSAGPHAGAESRSGSERRAR